MEKVKKYFKEYYKKNPPIMSNLDYEEMQIFAEAYYQYRITE